MKKNNLRKILYSILNFLSIICFLITGKKLVSCVKAQDFKSLPLWFYEPGSPEAPGALGFSNLTFKGGRF